MEPRRRAIVATLWLAVAGVMALTLEPAVPSTAGEVARLFVVVLATFLAIVYAVDPWGVLDHGLD
ncbi:hypothetical protein [Salinilacihabitans rarus]|uniref:hypothetical protein n=1 Tax=Salinilacihabitans rarus TaxID=2961596 RepID=UPI0020C91D89|nr:hypothetical protein [Salinilacihabitans rarus]